MHFASTVVSETSSLEIWTRFSLQMAVVVTGFIVSIVTLKRKQDKIERKVDRGNALAEPTGNGYAAKTLANDERIISAIMRNSEDISEIRDSFTRHLEHHIEKEN